MKRARIERAIEKAWRNVDRNAGFGHYNALLKFNVSRDVVTSSDIEFINSCREVCARVFTNFGWWDQDVRIVLILNDRRDVARHAEWLQAWFKRLKCRGAHVTLEKTVHRSGYDRRSYRRGQRNGRLPSW